MILPFPMPQVSDEERLRVLILKEKAEIEAQRIIIEKLKEKVDKLNED
tara:strand:+ start:166 stop:309 length:144 start_codon:yes stop_codon:yes gene_type:complete